MLDDTGDTFENVAIPEEDGDNFDGNLVSLRVLGHL
jgi:hypothetical protein